MRDAACPGSGGEGAQGESRHRVGLVHCERRVSRSGPLVDVARRERDHVRVTSTSLSTPQQSKSQQPQSIPQRIADELGVRPHQVTAAVDLLDGGATVPFIARYRKEATGSLDDAQLRTLEERLRYLRELEDRRTAVLESIRAQGKLDAVLEAQILVAGS